MSGKVAWSALLEHRSAPYDVPVETNAMVSFRNGELADPSGVDIILVIDVSTSMEGEPIDRVAKTYDFLVERCIRPNLDRVSLITFCETAKLQYSLTSEQSTWRSASGSFVSTFGTNIGAGLEIAFSQVELSSPARRPTVILMTDGHTMQPKELVRAFPSWCSRVSKWRPNLVALGFTDCHDQGLLQYLVSTAPRGRFMSVPDLDSIFSSLESVLAQSFLPTSLPSATFRVSVPDGVVIGDIHVGNGEQIERVSASVVNITIEDAEEERQRNILIPLTLPALASPESASNVVAVRARLTSPDGSTDESSVPSLTLARTSASPPTGAPRTDAELNMGVVGEAARVLVAKTLLNAYVNVKQYMFIDALDDISKGERLLAANEVVSAADGSRRDTPATVAHAYQLKRGKDAVEALYSKTSALMAATSNIDKMYQTYSFYTPWTNTLALLSDIGASELNERPSALIPQYRTPAMDAQIAAAKAAGLIANSFTAPASTPALSASLSAPSSSATGESAGSSAASESSTPTLQSLLQAKTAQVMKNSASQNQQVSIAASDIENVRFTGFAAFKETTRGGAQVELAERLQKRRARLDNPNAGADIEASIRQWKETQKSDAEKAAATPEWTATLRRTATRVGGRTDAAKLAAPIVTLKPVSPRAADQSGASSPDTPTWSKVSTKPVTPATPTTPATPVDIASRYATLRPIDAKKMAAASAGTISRLDSELASVLARKFAESE